MKLPDDLYSFLETLPWFSGVGSGVRTNFGFPVQWAKSQNEALAGFRSDVWKDAKTEAQGDLTGYLAKKRNDLYGPHWNNMVGQSRILLEARVKAVIAASLSAAELPDSYLDEVLLDVNRSVVEMAYRRLVPGAPDFFGRLLRVYEAGRLPCGWSGDLDAWPVGEVIVF